MKRWFKWLLLAFVAMVLCISGAITVLYLQIKPELPDVNALKDVQLQTPMKVYSTEGLLISQFGEKRRIPLKLNEIPEKMKQAFLATEDNRFYLHPGIDPIGISRAAVNLLLTGEKSQGASTITQQVARNFFLSREKTYIRKLKEVFLAIHIEQLLSKDEIFELYLNKISLGYRAYGVGAAAQVYYGKSVNELSLAEIAVIAGLPKAPSALNPIRSPERALARRAVVLSRMLSEGYISQDEFNEANSAPIETRYHGAEIELPAPYVAEMVRQQIIQLFGEDADTQGFNIYTTISAKHQNAANDALRNNLIAYDQRHGFRGAIANWLTTDNALPERNEMIEKLRALPKYAMLESAIVTELGQQTARILLRDGSEGVIPWQQMNWARKYISDKAQGNPPKTASDILNIGDLIWVAPSQLPQGDTPAEQEQRQEKQYTLSQLPDAGAALVALDPHDGAINALVGGFSYQHSKFNRVTQARRQVGSNIKPFIYSAAFDNGFTLASIVNDAPITKWDESAGVAWRPKNSPPVYNGPTRLRMALAQSKNVVSVRLLRSLSIETVIEQLAKFGFDPQQLPHNESLSLGSAELTPLQVATAFSIIANGGYKVEPYFIERVEDPYGQIVYQASPKLSCLSCKTSSSKTLSIDELMNIPGDPLKQCYRPIQPNYEQAEQVISEQTAFLVREAMSSAIYGGGNWNDGSGWNGTGWRAARELQRPDLAGKTGTTNDSKDAWFSGFTPDLVATSWLGFDDFRRELGTTTQNSNIKEKQISGVEFGGKTALPAWILYMKEALNGVEAKEKVIPPQITTVRIDLATGLLARKSNTNSRFEYFKAGTEPTQYAPSQDGATGDLFSGEDQLF